MSMSTHKQYELKKILMELYRPIVETGNDIRNNENLILCYKNSKTGVMEETRAFNNIDDFIMYIANSKRTSYCETYFNLYTTEGQVRKTEYIKTACFIGLDFDRKDFEVKGIELNIDYIQSKFHELGLFYNLLINSGNGIHVYIYIEPTQDIDLVVKVAKEIANRTGADINACKPTQLLRVPFTFNNKQLSEGIKKPVVLIHMDESPMRKDINKIAKKLFRKETGTNKTLKITNGCMRINKLITEPIEKGKSRHEELLWLYGKLLQFNTTEGQIMVALEKFQELNNLEDFEYQVKWLKENGKTLSPCGNCKYKDQCHNYTAEDFKHRSSGTLIKTNEKILSKCKKKGVRNMNGNMLIIYGILKIHNEPLFKDELMNEMTFRNKKKEIINVVMSERTLIRTLKEMEEKKFITSETVGKKKMYSLARERTQEELNINLPFSLVYDVVRDNLTPEELQFYIFLCYLQNEQKRLDPNITGSEFIMVQEEIAKKYGVTRKCVNELISELDRKFYIVKKYRQSQNNRRDYCVYYLVY